MIRTDPLRALLERPLGEQPQHLARDAAAAGGRRGDVAELDLGALAVELGGEREAEERAVVVDRRERFRAAVPTRGLVARQPLALEPGWRGLRDAREAQRVGVVEKGGDGAEMTVFERF